MTKKPQVFRVCAVCGKRHGVTYGFRNTLSQMGIKGDKAVPKCVERSMRDFNERLKDFLRDLYPVMRSEHDAGDGHFSTEQVERIMHLIEEKI